MQKFQLFSVAAASLLAGSAAASNLAVGDPAPPIAVAKWVQGTPVINGPGGLRVVEFWATWCGPCKQSIPHLTELSKKYAGRVTFTGVDVFERSPDDVATVQAFLKTMGPKMTYNVAVDDKQGTMGKTWMRAAHQPGIPTAFIIDRSGTVAWIGHPMAGLDKALDQMLAGAYDLQKAKNEFAAQMAVQAEREALQKQISDCMKEYADGKKDAALADLAKIQTNSPEGRQELTMARFSLLSREDRKAAEALADKTAEDDKPNAAYAYLRFGAMAGMHKGAKPEDVALGMSLADKALKLSPTDPLVEYEVAMFYAENKQPDKAIALDQDALKNLANAKPDMQDQLKQAIQEKLWLFRLRRARTT